MRAQLLISWRYLITKRKEKFLSLISVISVLGIAIGVAALIVVIAVMSGFDRDLRDKIVGNYAHITLVGYEGISEQDILALEKKITAFSHVEAISPFMQGQMLIKEGMRYLAVDFKGIDPLREARVSKVKQYIISGSLDQLQDNGVIVGKELAAYLGLQMGSPIQIFSPLGKEHTLKVTGIFSSGMYDYDAKLVFMHYKESQKILSMEGKLSGLAIKLDNMSLADKLVPDIVKSVGYNYAVRSWTQANASFFAALKLEKLVMFVILTLIILVASFNIISTLIVMVIDKTKDIGILKALGMTSRSIQAIFMLEGIIIGSLGTLFGAAGGIGICLLLEKYKFIKLPQDIYYIDSLPVQLQLWPDIGLIVGCAFLITLASTFYPAVKAARLLTVDALRYE